MKQKIFRTCFALLLLIGAFWTADQLAFSAPTVHAQADFSCANVTEIPQIECEALAALMDANPSALITDTWFDTDTPCSWLNITCLDGQVAHLSLEFMGLTILPPEFGSFSALTSLNLYGNTLTSLPPELGNLSALISLNLAGNELTNVPPELGDLSALTSLDLAQNQLTSLPPELGDLSALTSLDLAQNQLTSLPPEFNNLAQNVLAMIVGEGIEIEGYEYVFSCDNVSEIPLSECEALVALSEANPDRFNRWFESDTPCSWNGITCLDGQITELFLGYNELTSVPRELGNLSALTSLFLEGNQFTSVPSELRNLSQDVVTMILNQGIQIEGEYVFSCDNVSEIPQIECEALVALTDANPNRFNLWLSTDTPCTWVAITCLDGRITELYLADNELTSVPPELGNLSALTWLSLGGNQLTSVPSELGNLPQDVIAMIVEAGIEIEEYEYVFSCDNVSEIPQVECEALVALADANPNRFNLWFNTDTPCTWVAITCLDGRITELYLADNELTSVPPELGNLSSLTSLNLYNNELTSLPPELGNLSALTSLSLGQNQLTSLPTEFNNLAQSVLAMIVGGGIEIEGYEYVFSCDNVSEIPLSECVALVALSDANPERFNRWLNTDTPCSWTAITCLDGQIADLYLANNELTSVPPELGNLSALTSLSLANNALTSVPPELGNLSALTSLSLADNALTSVPPELGNLSALERLDVRENQLMGLPSELGSLPLLTSLELYSNELTSLPPELGNLSALERLNLERNQLMNLPPELGNLSALTYLDLSNNQLASVPPELGNLSALTFLDLRFNQLMGLPTEINNLRRLDTLHVWGNPFLSPYGSFLPFITR